MLNFRVICVFHNCGITHTGVFTFASGNGAWSEKLALSHTALGLSKGLMVLLRCGRDSGHPRWQHRCVITLGVVAGDGGERWRLGCPPVEWQFLHHRWAVLVEIGPEGGRRHNSPPRVSLPSLTATKLLLLL
jgi:hypothetical protein